MKARQSVLLLRRMGKPFRHLGSAVMRGDQLAALVSPHLDHAMTVRAVPFHAKLMPPVAMSAFARRVPLGAVVIVVKSAAKGLTADHLAPLRARGVRIGYDSIDTAIGEIDFDLYDFHIAASVGGKAALEAALATRGRTDVPVELLHHHHDPRLAGHRAAETFACGYVGERKNAMIPQALASEVEVIEVNYAREFARILPRLDRLSLHYAVRPAPTGGDRQNRVYKPFTKGFTAAALGANILVNREVDDVLALLGEDYPYLVSITAPDTIIEGFEHARATFGGPVWTDALDRMRALNALVQPAALAARMSEIVEIATSRPR
ncbi:hypothetical protein [Jannaschia aquimarina]|uniref:Uncharacterized protein n=1 Tax=Jannaschia aquimarina TaxID=935700 RepID=A0A0D1EK48_9RHOB|nr:hypothetical protein [Jannaschia aquimarina]KIT17944.1 hypothetical protein jaqu_03010 [Jannaschia aquimarina]SNT08391.1 hypothetical protein SAMN05421775_105172 [Jannaschia aquimarina]